MSAESSNLFTMARNKLHMTVGGRDNCSLHRWVLLKNSMFRSQPAPSPVAVTGPPSPISVFSEHDEDDEDDGEVEESDSFMFPDASNLVVHGGTDMNASEAEWLDSLLETLCEGEEDGFCSDADVRVSVVAVDDDEEYAPLSPLTSPMSSSDDLLNQNAYYSPPIAVPYPVPYPPFHPPLVRPYELGPIIESPLISPPPAYDALPYYDIDELDDLSVPDAIEDTSDDESDAPSTPSLGHCSDIFFVDPASVPLPGERRRRRSQPHVYIRTTGSFIDRYELDPLPFPDEDNFRSYNPVYQEC
ncbi:hypothetical protein HYDPIDRAFT_36423 [Hydnomerulius pinastri MD-312]|nr:hypothetical protein HYDPIDRAFT_36423 [Hydnomerulius pinastri MD-312]